MTDKRAVVAYRYHLTDVDTWTDHAVDVFYNRLQREDRTNAP